MAEPLFRGIIDFMVDLGIYDVILPFLLVFSIVFAILEKTRVFGMDKVGDREVTKKNINSMVAFVMAFLVIASKKLVGIINESLANVVLILILIVMILVLIGSFYKKDEEVAFEGPLRSLFIAIAIISVVIIFMHAVPTDDGSNWLDVSWNYVLGNWDSNIVSGIAMVVIMGLFIYFIVGKGDNPASGSKSS